VWCVPIVLSHYCVHCVQYSSLWPLETLLYNHGHIM
jgi:hypothetical protein